MEVGEPDKPSPVVPVHLCLSTVLNEPLPLSLCSLFLSILLLLFHLEIGNDVVGVRAVNGKNNGQGHVTRPARSIDIQIVS